MQKLYNTIDQAYQKRKENLTPEIDHLKSQQKDGLGLDRNEIFSFRWKVSSPRRRR